MSINTSNENGIFILIPNGRFDATVAPDAEKLITSAIEDGESKIIVDFSETEFIASAGLRIIIITAKLLKPKNGIVALCSANQQIKEVLDISGFLALMNLHDSREDAFSKMNA